MADDPTRQLPLEDGDCYEARPTPTPVIGFDVLDHLPPLAIYRHMVNYVADHGWDGYGRRVLGRLREAGYTRRAVDDGAQRVRAAEHAARLAR